MADNALLLRRYKRTDIPAMIAMVQASLIENRSQAFDHHYKGLDFDAEKVYKVLDRNVHNKDFFCLLLVQSEEIVGGLAAEIAEPMFSSSRIAFDHFLYIHPDHTNLRAVVRMIKNYICWAEDNNAAECRLCSSIGYNHEGFTKLCKYLKFNQFEIGFARRF
jgi:hypothetical protein